MKLFLNATSPFARLVRVAALEKNLQASLELVWCDPWANAAELLAVHPQARIPVLVTEDGQAIAESLLIAQYLDALDAAPSLVPASEAAAVLAETSLGYGLMEAAFGTTIARKHEGRAADQGLMGQRRLAAMDRALRLLEQKAVAWRVPEAGQAALRLDQITVAVALEYVGFRLPELLPAGAYPGLEAWLQAMRQRPSLVATAFA
ncbi:glutathione S-transferase family protein [Comamonas composti]|uniref:glutathione S-transferase family protein n=1 Tax=Comamonas composti TaxID=408558 RepID=UPI000407700D|nr:glutathione S-transferase N-terminal domain-containing protein [Comamonas composti]